MSSLQDAYDRFSNASVSDINAIGRLVDAIYEHVTAQDREAAKVYTAVTSTLDTMGSWLSEITEKVAEHDQLFPERPLPPAPAKERVPGQVSYFGSVDEESGEKLIIVTHDQQTDMAAIETYDPENIAPTRTYTAMDAESMDRVAIEWLAHRQLQEAKRFGDTTREDDIQCYYIPIIRDLYVGGPCPGCGCHGKLIRVPCSDQILCLNQECGYMAAIEQAKEAK